MLTLEQTTAIATLLPAWLEDASGALAGAFLDSPLARYCFADQEEYYDRAVRAYARLTGARLAAAGGTHLGAYDDGQLVGAAGLVPPEPRPLPAALESRRTWFATVVGLEAAERIARVERLVARYRPPEPHVALVVLGVLPGARDRGAGAALLDAARAYAEAHPTAAGVYAVAASPEGVALYERAGYRAVGRERLEDLTLSCLFRPSDGQ